MTDSEKIEQLEARINHADTKIESLRIAALISTTAAATMGKALGTQQLSDEDRAIVAQATSDFNKLASRLSDGAEGEE